MEILKLESVYKDYIWGGTELIRKYNKKPKTKSLSEAWELACHPSGSNIILNGEFKNKHLDEYFNFSNYYRDNTIKDRFPIMIKLINSLYPLSIQVHPDDDYALKNENDLGKDEFWYILEADLHSSIYYGLNKDYSKQDVFRSLSNNSITSLLNKVEVKKGDMFYIKAGTIHAIGAAITLCEIQENSNSTYRLYDYNRLDSYGKPRILHIEKALDVINYNHTIIHNQYTSKCESNRINLVSCKFFSSSLYTSNSMSLFTSTSSFHSIVIIEGAGLIKADGQTLNFVRGDSFYIPSGFGNYEIIGKCKFILTTK